MKKINIILVLLLLCSSAQEFVFCVQKPLGNNNGQNEENVKKRKFDQQEQESFHSDKHVEKKLKTRDTCLGEGIQSQRSIKRKRDINVSDDLGEKNQKKGRMGDYIYQAPVIINFNNFFISSWRRNTIPEVNKAKKGY